MEKYLPVNMDNGIIHFSLPECNPKFVLFCSKSAHTVRTGHSIPPVTDIFKVVLQI